MDYKIIAIDLDDTLLNEQLEISKANKVAIKAAQDKEVKVIIATGRTYRSALPYVKELGINGPTLTYNGALVKDSTDDRTIYHFPIPQSSAQKINQIVKREDLHLNAYLEGKMYVNQLGSEARAYEELSGIKANLTDDMAKLLAKRPTKMLVIEDDLEKVERLLTEFRAELSAELNIFLSKPNFIEILPKGVSKGSTLKRLASDLKVKKEEVIAIGDSYNDLEMIEYAGVGAAVGNARAELKEVADYISSSNNQAGVAKLIEEYIL